MRSLATNEVVVNSGDSLGAKLMRVTFEGRDRGCTHDDWAQRAWKTKEGSPNILISDTHRPRKAILSLCQRFGFLKWSPLEQLYNPDLLRAGQAL